MLLVLSLALAASATASASASDGGGCRPDALVLYRLTFASYWDRDTFPKQYPEWRPAAQWSKLVGKLVTAGI